MGSEGIEEYGQTKFEWLRKVIPLENDIPAHDTIARVVSRMSAKGLQECFTNWVNAVHRVSEGEVVAIDGKTVRRSFDGSSRKGAIHMGKRVGESQRFGAGSAEDRGEIE